MISTELLSEVLGIDVAKIIENSDRNISIYERDFKYPMSYNASAYLTINIYELAHKCKEWAIKIDYKIESHIHFINKRIIGVASFNTQDNTTKFFQADTEPEAIFKACQWILEQRSNQ